MGAQQSSASTQDSEKVFHPEQQQQQQQQQSSGSISFSPELIAQLSDSSSSTSPSQTRQSTLDDQVRHKLQTSLASLRKQESLVSSQLHSALQASNTTHELNASSSGTSSAILSRDIDEVREKVQRLERKKEEGGGEEIKSKREKVRECYLNHPTRTLDCWKEAEEFKAAVAKLEAKFVSSLR